MCFKVKVPEPEIPAPPPPPEETATDIKTSKEVRKRRKKAIKGVQDLIIPLKPFNQ